ncbi:hypothetical protein [Nonomuraea rosea]|uniref:hypothetical protein n=1 Tax=Nonomuraea rosea TaxID=638574 RepID=UPI0031E863B9
MLHRVADHIQLNEWTRSTNERQELNEELARAFRQDAMRIDAVLQSLPGTQPPDLPDAA